MGRTGECLWLELNLSVHVSNTFSSLTSLTLLSGPRILSPFPFVFLPCWCLVFSLSFLLHISLSFTLLPLQVGNVVTVKKPEHGLYPLIGLCSIGEKVCDYQWH